MPIRTFSARFGAKIRKVKKGLPLNWPPSLRGYYIARWPSQCYMERMLFWGDWGDGQWFCPK
ncbi:TPA: hypothetical protein DD394_09225 [bacterium UBP9_UBA11836]|nr:hypothetical protein [bacterium UBP9_UBA11836]